MKNRKIIFIAILIIGIIFRIIALSDYPKGFYPQEALLGYRALLLSNIGKDELNRKMPLLFVSPQDYQLPISTYVILPFVKVAGLSKLTVRLPFAIAGIMSIVGVFLLGKLLFKSEKQSNLPYWLAFLFAINPWGVFLSRIPNSESLGFVYFIFGFYFLLKHDGIGNIDYAVSIILLSLSLYSDKTAWIFIFIFLILLVFVKSKNILLITKQKLITTIIFLGIILLPLLWSYSKLPQFENSLKANNFSLFSDIGISNGINQMRGEDIRSGYAEIGRLFYNKSFWLEKLSSNVLKHFVPRFYFASGDQDSTHGLSNFAPLFLVLIIPAIYALINLLRNKDPLAVFIFVWLLAASLPSALMSNSPDQLKFYYAIPAVLILVAWGIENLPKKAFLVLASFLVFNLIFVYSDAISKEPFRYSQKWSTEFDQVSAFIQDNYSNFDHIFITNKYFSDPIPQYLFSTKYSPDKYFSGLSPINISYRLWMNNVGKISSGEITELKFKNSDRNLFIIIPQEVNKITSATDGSCYKIVKKIKDKNEKEILLFVESSIDECKYSKEKI